MRSRNQCRCKKAIRFTYFCVCVYERVLVLSCVCECGCTGAGVFLRACSLTSTVCSAPPYSHLWRLWLHHVFPHCLINETIFGKTLLNIKCVFWFYLRLSFEIFLILRRIQRAVVINVKSLHVKYPLFFSDFNETWTFSTDFRKEKSESQVSSKSVQWEPSCSIHTGRRTCRS